MRLGRALLIASYALSFFAPWGLTAQSAQSVEYVNLPSLKWTADLNHADKQLRAGKWEKGVRTAQNLIEEIGFHPTIGTGLVELLARSVTLRAIGEAGQGDAAAARWDATAARELGIKPSNFDFEPYGEAGKLVLAAVEAPPEGPSEVLTAAGEVTRPEIRSRVDPVIPQADRERKIHGSVIVEAVIDEQGTPHTPHILQSASPRYALAALDALRQWRFAPGTRAGKPVSVYYVLTVEY